MRDGELICPKHGSLFDACSGHCDNGKAAGTDLQTVSIAVNCSDVFLAAAAVTYRHDGGIEDDDGPSSTSHLPF